MKLTDRLLSLAVAALMMIGAAVTVNKRVFGHPISSSACKSTYVSESLTVPSSGEVTVHTAELKGTLPGYAGPVPLDIHIANGRISYIDALPNTETPSFFKRAAVILQSWNGLTPSEALATRPDAVTGATYSSQAIISNVEVGLEYYSGLNEKAATETPLKIWIAFAVSLAACILPLFIRSRLYHRFQLIANIVVLGFWCGMFLDYTLMLKYISDGFIWPVGLVAVAMLVSAFIYPLFGRPQHYCNHICPLGAAQQLAAEFCGYKIPMSTRMLRVADNFRRMLWAVLMLALWTDCLTEWMDYELFQAFQFKSASPYILVAAGLFVLLSTVIARPYCRFVCPTGSLFKQAENIG